MKSLKNIQDVELKIKSIELEDGEQVLITDEGNFTVTYNDKAYYVNFYTINPDEEDTMVIRVFRRPYQTDEGLITEAYLDSTGGSVADEVLSTGVEEVDNIIVDFLFGEEPAILPF